jgi:myo-inositol-1(or 4)-monophosphatase
MSRRQDLERIEKALRETAEVLSSFFRSDLKVERKEGGDPVTEADRAANEVLMRLLPSDGDGWLSEETVDDPARLRARRVWIVDPLDGPREFVTGIPEWSVSIGLVEDGVPVAGGICNPATGQTVLGAPGLGVTLNGQPVATAPRAALDGAHVLASRSEVKRGEWERFRNAPFRIEACGSVAFKLARVAAGLADATWTLVPKHEWDVAAGVALVLAAGGKVWLPTGGAPSFNRPSPKLPGLIATSAALAGAASEFLAVEAGAARG